MIERLCKNGVEITLEEVLREAENERALGRPHLARALVKRGHVNSVAAAFERFLHDASDAYVPLERLSSLKAIALMKASSAISVLAHPMRLREPEHVEELIALGIDGLEVIHPTASNEDEQRLRNMAVRSGLIATGGTDFHAPVPGRPIGVEYRDEDLEMLRSALAKAAAGAPPAAPISEASP